MFYLYKIGKVNVFVVIFRAPDNISHYPLEGATVVLLRDSAETGYQATNTLKFTGHFCRCERLDLFAAYYRCISLLTLSIS